MTIILLLLIIIMTMIMLQVSNQVALKELGTVFVPSCVRAILFVPGSSGGVAAPSTEEPLKSDIVFVATDDKKLTLYR